MTKKESPRVKNEQLIGTWKLVSCEYIARGPNGEVSYAYGKNPFGRLIYDSDGNMFVFFMDPDRPKFASGNRLGGTPEELKAAFERFHAYCGTYKVDEEKGTVTHHVEGDAVPNFVGMDRVRFFKLSGDQLELISPLQHIVWERKRK